MKNKSTEVITLGLAGKTVPEQLASIATALAQLQSVKESSYKTSMNLEGFGDLKSTTDIKSLIKAGSVVAAKESAYNNFAVLAGLTSYPSFEINGGNLKDWTKDIKIRIAVISEKDVREKLQKAHDKLSQFLTDTEKRAQAEKEISSLLEGLNLDTQHLLD